MALRDVGDAVQEVAAAEVAVAAVANNGLGPVDDDSLEVGLDTGEEELVLGDSGSEDAASAADGDDLDVDGRVNDESDLRASKGLLVDLVSNLSGEPEQRRLDVAGAPVLLVIGVHDARSGGWLWAGGWYRISPRFLREARQGSYIEY